MLSRVAVRPTQAGKPRAARVVPSRLFSAPTGSLSCSPFAYRAKVCGLSSVVVPSASVQLNYTQSRIQKRFFSEESVVIKVPSMGDSITDGAVGEIKKNVGEAVEADEVVLVVETTKINHEIRAPKAGVITEILVKVGDTVLVDQPVFKVAAGATATAQPAAPKAEAKVSEAPKAPQAATQTAPQAPAAQAPAAPKSTPPQAPPPKPLQPVAPKTAGDRSERREPMSRMRQTIAKNMKDSQNTLAMLTTFQEADMHELTQLRAQLKDDFEAKHGVKLGFMSCFVKAAAAALKENPAVNALIDGKEIVYRNYVDISVAVATPKGLVVPVLKNVDQMSFADIEKQIAYLGQKARNGAITLEDITGGTFTISNGGVYGSLMGTPIINPGQSAILGMHGIFERPVVVNKQVVIRPMMYLALTYDHRLIDGRDAVTFLKKIKLSVEDPRRLLLD